MFIGDGYSIDLVIPGRSLYAMYGSVSDHFIRSQFMKLVLVDINDINTGTVCPGCYCRNSVLQIKTWSAARFLHFSSIVLNDIIYSKNNYFKSKKQNKQWTMLRHINVWNWPLQVMYITDCKGCDQYKNLIFCLSSQVSVMLILATVNI